VVTRSVEPVEGFTTQELLQRINLDAVFAGLLEHTIRDIILFQVPVAVAAYRVYEGNWAAVQERLITAIPALRDSLRAQLPLAALAAADYTHQSLFNKKGYDTSFRELMLQWARERTGKLIVGITETTVNRVRSVIERLLAEGIGIPAIMQQIIPLVNGIGNINALARARTIARTETHAAASFGADEYARRSGVEYIKVWISSEDARTRASHAAAHGQRRFPNETFSIGGHAMMRPGEGPASETINCRCVLVYRSPPRNKQQVFECD
jgi:hypothetical protein